MLIGARDDNFSVKDQEQIVLDTVESYAPRWRASPG